MRSTKVKTLCLSFLVGLTFFGLSPGQKPKINRPVILKTWDLQAFDAFQMQLPDPRVSTKPISSAYYYSIPVRPIYKSYDVYRPDREPPAREGARVGLSLTLEERTALIEFLKTPVGCTRHDAYE